MRLALVVIVAAGCAASHPRPAPTPVDARPAPTPVDAPAARPDADVCTRGDAEQCLMLAHAEWHDGKETRAAVDHMEHACSLGSRGACEALADMYANNADLVGSAYVTSPDPQRGVRVVALLEGACAQKDGPVCMKLGLVLLRGDTRAGVAVDGARGAAAVRRACDAGEQSACTSATH